MIYVIHAIHVEWNLFIRKILTIFSSPLYLRHIQYFQQKKKEEKETDKFIRSSMKIARSKKRCRESNAVSFRVIFQIYVYRGVVGGPALIKSSTNVVRIARFYTRARGLINSPTLRLRGVIRSKYFGNS